MIRRAIVDTLMTGDLMAVERNLRPKHTAQSRYLRTKPATGTKSMKKIRWKLGKKLKIIQRLWNFWEAKGADLKRAQE